MKKTNKKGFTLVELVIVIAVIAILAAVLIPTFTSVIHRANQSASLQKWKAIVDEAYVEYVAEEHDIPTHVTVVETKVVFSKTTDTELVINTYTLDTDSELVTTPYGTFVTLDETNNVYLVWNTDSTYAVVASDTSLGTTTKYTTYTKSDNTYTLVTEVTFDTFEYNNVTYLLKTN